MRRILIGAIASVCLIALVVLAGCQPAPPPGPDVPAGSLWLLAEAADQADWGTMLVYMDPVAVGSNFAVATVGRLEEDGESETADSGSGSHGSAFTAGPMVTGFTEAFVTNLQANAANGTLLAEGNLVPVILDDGLGETEYVSDDEALVDIVLLTASGDETPVRLRMVRDAEHWKLIAVEDTTDLYEVFF
ncbi:MAG: hypothetical protein ACYCXR_05265 [Coriobacteriia bacterium]